MLSIESIQEIKESDKLSFGFSSHFGLGLYIRNSFGINSRKCPSLLGDLSKNHKAFLYMPDSMSGFIIDELWEEVNENYDVIIGKK